MTIVKDPQASQFDILLVWDKGNFDQEIADALESKNIRIIENSNLRGVAGALNCGLNQVKTKVTRRFDSDDIWVPWKMNYEFLNLVYEHKLVSGNNLIKLNNRTYRPRMPRLGFGKVGKYQFLPGNPINHPSVYFETDTIKEHGGYSENVVAEDFELWLRLSNLDLNFFHVNENFTIYRRHKNQISNSLNSIQVAGEVNDHWQRIVQSYNLDLDLNFLNVALCRNKYCKHNFKDIMQYLDELFKAKSKIKFEAGGKANFISRALISPLKHSNSFSTKNRNRLLQKIVYKFAKYS